jgi:hypothetical protein
MHFYKLLLVFLLCYVNIFKVLGGIVISILEDFEIRLAKNG